MQVKYENVKFNINLKHSLELHLVKQAIKRKIGRFIGKPYVTDDYLKFARTILTKAEKPVIVDVGCNIGTTVIPLASEFPLATFFAIEPHPLPASHFIINCELNRIENVNLVSCAIGDDHALCQIYTCPNNSGGHRVTGFRGRKDLDHLNAFGPISIPMKPLASIFTDLKIERCDLLKIDTEGYETSVLRSLGQLLDPERIPCVIAEMGSEGLAKANSSPVELLSILLGKGYKCCLLQDRRAILSEKDLPDLPDFVVKDLLCYKG